MAEEAAEREVSAKGLYKNILNDQKRIFTFPRSLTRDRRWVAPAFVLGATAGLVALDPHDSPYFRQSSTFQGFNRVFSGRATGVGIIGVPAAFGAAGLLRKDQKMQKTALLAAEAIADSQIVTTVLKDLNQRLRPAAVPAQGNFADTWFDSTGSLIGGRGSFPSGHTMMAFSVATVVAHQYKNHRWVPFVAYAAAAAVGFSRVSNSAHFPSDVLIGGAIGYSLTRFAVLR